MAVLDWLTENKKTLEDLTLEDIKKEKRRLDIREGKALKKLEKLESRKEEVFRKGARVSSDLRRRQLARKYRQTEKKLDLVERKLNRISKQLVTLSAMGLALERREHLKEGLMGLVSDISEEEIREMLEDDRISYDMYMERLDDMLEESAVLSDEEFLEEIGEEGREVIETWEAMDQGEFDSMEDAMDTVEEDLDVEEEGELSREARETFEEEL